MENNSIDQIKQERLAINEFFETFADETLHEYKNFESYKHGKNILSNSFMSKLFEQGIEIVPLDEEADI